VSFHSASGVYVQDLKKVVRPTCWSTVLLCVVTGVVSPAFAQQSASSESSALTQATQLPDSPGATLAKLQAPQSLPDQSPAQSSAQTSGEPQAQAPQASSPSAPKAEAPDAQAPPQKPVGTAAAEPTHASGIAASQPAGVAIAPAKQRRTRTIIIRTGAIIGAGVAVGTVVALTAATSSKPPGAH
jgi:hypothetical protein